MNTELTIGKVATQAGVNIQTVRYYERRGLLNPDGRRDSGYRLYTDEAVRKIQFIKNAQALGFTLREIMQLLRLKVSDTARCGDVKRKAEAKLKDIRAKMEGLKALEKTLADLVRTCRSGATTDRCPVLKSLEVQRGGRGSFGRTKS